MASPTNFISRRKVIYPFFVVVFCIVILVLFYLYFFSEPLRVFESSISVAGEDLVLNIGVENISNHIVKDIQVVIGSGVDKKIALLKPKDNFLSPGEKYTTIIKFPLIDSNFYEVNIQSPFIRDLKLLFEIEESTLRPVKAEVFIPSKMVVGKKYDIVYKLCNISNNHLFEVSWLETVDNKYFSGDYFLKTISLNVDECINLYSTLTPISSGDTRISFLLKVGSLEQKLSKEIEILNE
ncbi:MAG TPA: hypothetical protein PKK60_01755 [archaeon]|nr:hypothetical protein [archaeon]